ncbi:hypothetical protein [Azospirillum brasilense]|uniref:hypothetical protein n=1 Tax=Azospirillum brasilense TaxID=192 RepID=UPI0011EE0822|nr:hypothetical protein [Azospirillum brasilense]
MPLLPWPDEKPPFFVVSVSVGGTPFGSGVVLVTDRPVKPAASRPPPKDWMALASSPAVGSA